MEAMTENRDVAAADTGILAALWRHARVIDLLLLAVVPAVLFWVYTLPAATRRALSFTYTDPTVLSAYTAHFVHFSPDHLFANVMAYLLLAGVGYTLAVLAGKRLFFGAAAIAILLVVPGFLSGLNLAFPRYAIGFGTSGLNMALLGVLPLLLVSYARQRLDLGIPLRAAPVAFFALLGWMTFLALPFSLVTLALAGAGAAGIVVYAVSLRAEQLPSLGTVKDRILATGGFGDLFVVGVVLMVAYPVVGFPTDPATTGRVVNLYAHLLGFALAFIGPYWLLETGIFDETG